MDDLVARVETEEFLKQRDRPHRVLLREHPASLLKAQVVSRLGIADGRIVAGKDLVDVDRLRFSLGLDAVDSADGIRPRDAGLPYMVK